MQAEKNSTTPPQKGRFWGCRNFCKTAFFGLISAVFDSGGPIWSQNGLGGTKNFLRELWNPFGADQENFDHPTQIGRFGGCRNFYQLSLDHFWSKKIFWPIFWVGKESYLEWSHACWMVPLCQKCTIMRSKGPGTLYIEFRDHLSKLEKWPNSANFDKLTVGS